MAKKVIDKSGYNGGTVETPAVITKPARKKKAPQDVGPWYKNGTEVTREEFLEGLDDETVGMVNRIEEKIEKARIAQDVKNSWKSAKPVKEKWKSKKPSNEEVVEAHDNGMEIVVDERGMPSVSETKVVKRKSYNLGGRPTKYKEEYADMLLDFCSGISQEIYIDRKYYDRKVRGEWDDNIRPDGDGYKRHLVKDETHKVIASTFPTLARFAYKIDVSVMTLWEWSTATYPIDYREKAKAWKLKYPRFSYAYARAKEMQEGILIENGLNGTFNAQFAQFVLKNNHGYKDKTEVEQTSLGVLGVMQLSEEKRNALEYAIATKIRE